MHVDELITILNTYENGLVSYDVQVCSTCNTEAKEVDLDLVYLKQPLKVYNCLNNPENTWRISPSAPFSYFCSACSTSCETHPVRVFAEVNSLLSNRIDALQDRLDDLCEQKNQNKAYCISCPKCSHSETTIEVVTYQGPYSVSHSVGFFRWETTTCTNCNAHDDLHTNFGSRFRSAHEQIQFLRNISEEIADIEEERRILLDWQASFHQSLIHQEQEDALRAQS